MRWQQQKRDRKKARAWMFEHDVRIVDLQRAVGHKYLTQAQETLAGSRSNRAVLNHLLALGCPPECLDLPKKMLQQAAA